MSSCHHSSSFGPLALFSRLVFSSIFPHSLLLCDFCVQQFSFFVLVLWQNSSIFLMHACCNCVTSPIFPVCCLVCVFIICPQLVRFVTFIFDLSIFLMHLCDFWRGVRSCVQCGCTVLAKLRCLEGCTKMVSRPNYSFPNMYDMLKAKVDRLSSRLNFKN